MKSRKIVAGIFSAVALAAAGRAIARESRGQKEADEVAAYAQVKLTLADAIATAERETGGKAVEAKLEQEHGTLSFEVEIMKDLGFRKVVIDAKTGQVLKSDAADREDDEDGEHDGD